MSGLIKVFFLILFSSGIFQFYPMLFFLREGWYVLLFLITLMVLAKQFMEKGNVLTKFEWYVILTAVFIPFLSAYAANNVFGQPWSFGFLTQRVMVLYFASLVLIYLGRFRLITLRQLERVVVFLGWFCLVLYFCIDLTLSPSAFRGARGFVGGGVVQPYQFIFKSAFLVFNVLYYFIRGASGRGFWNFAYTIPFLLFLAFIDGGRSQFIALIAAIGIYSLREISFRKIFVSAIPGAILGLALAFSVNHFMQDELEHQIGKFSDAISVVLTGEESGDSSANARIRETEVAMPYIKENLLLGNGMLSVQWESGFFSKLGKFAPSDIGLIGLLFVHGVVGLLIVYAQFFFAYMTTRKFDRRLASPFVKAIRYFLVYGLLDSLATGRVVFAGCVSFMFIAMLYIDLFQRTRKQPASREMTAGVQRA